MRLLLIALVGCSTASADSPKLGPALPCPDGPLEWWSRELYPGCAALPLTQQVVACPAGGCAQPCRIETGGEAFAISYDDKGRWYAAKSKTKSEACVYKDGHLDTCNATRDGKTIRSNAVRDAKGRLVELEGDLALAFQYTTAGKVSKTLAPTSTTEHTYDAKGRLVKLVEKGKRVEQTTTFKYTAAGSIDEIASELFDSTATKYRYDARGRLTSVTTTTKPHGAAAGSIVVSEELTYDSGDRLIENKRTGDGAPATTKYIYKCP